MKAKHAAVAGGLALGFIAGGVAGLFWGKKTRERAPGATSTSWDSGVLTVRFDAQQATLGQLSRYLQ